MDAPGPRLFRQGSGLVYLGIPLEFHLVPRISKHQRLQLAAEVDGRMTVYAEAGQQAGGICPPFACRQVAFLQSGDLHPAKI